MTMFTYETCPISNIQSLLKEGYEVEILSPDGYVPVPEFVDKGVWEEYVLTTVSGLEVRVNEDHLFETEEGWKYAKDLVDLKFEVLTESGYEFATVIRTGESIPIVDIQVDHCNHRYFANGVSSHNTNVGKSFGLCSLTSDYLRDGRNVLYVTCEMREEEVAARVDSNLLGLGQDALRELEKETFTGRINKLKAASHGRLFVKEFPTGAGTALDVQNAIDELRVRKGFIPDIVICDYLTIMTSYKVPNEGNSYFLYKAVSTELRALAVRNDIVLWSACQFNRGGIDSSDAGLSELSESAAIAHIADFMIGLFRTEETDLAHQIIGKQLKNRYANKSTRMKFVLGADIDTQTIYDVEDGRQLDVASQEKIQMSQKSLKDKFMSLK